jgi:hypothetical protein
MSTEATTVTHVALQPGALKVFRSTISVPRDQTIELYKFERCSSPTTLYRVYRDTREEGKNLVYLVHLRFHAPPVCFSST